MTMPKFPSLWEKHERELLEKLRGGQGTPEDFRMFQEIVVFKQWIATLKLVVEAREMN